MIRIGQAAFRNRMQVAEGIAAVWSNLLLWRLNRRSVGGGRWRYRLAAAVSLRV